MLINVTLSRSGASLKTVQKSSLLLPNRRIRICLRLVKIYFVVEKYPDLLIETWSATLLPLIKNIWGGAFIKSRTNSGKSRHPDTTFWNLNEWNLRSYSSALLTCNSKCWGLLCRIFLWLQNNPKSRGAY